MSPRYSSAGAVLEAPTERGAEADVLLLTERMDGLEREVGALRAAIEELSDHLGRLLPSQSDLPRREDLSSFATEVVETLLHTRDLEKALGPEPTLKRRTVDVDEMLARHRIEPSDVDRLLEADAGMMSASDFATHLGLTPQALHSKRKNGQVIGLSQAKRKVWFPVAQLDDTRRILNGIGSAIQLCHGDAWAAHRYLAARHSMFDGATGYDALRQGRFDEVLTAMRGMRNGAYE